MSTPPFHVEEDGATIRFSLDRITKTSKTGKCTATSYDKNGVVLESSTSSTYPANPITISGSVSLSTSDNGTWGGYYMLQCLLPPKWTLQSLEVED